MAEGPGRVSAANWRIFFWGGGAKYFFGGAEMSTKLRAQILKNRLFSLYV